MTGIKQLFSSGRLQPQIRLSFVTRMSFSASLTSSSLLFLNMLFLVGTEFVLTL